MGRLCTDLFFSKSSYSLSTWRLVEFIASMVGQKFARVLPSLNPRQRTQKRLSVFI